MNIGTANIVSDEVSEDIIRCLKTLYSTPEGTQPMDREFGISTKMVGLPLEILKNQYALEIIKKTEAYETRVTVEEVTFSMDGDTVVPNIHLKEA